MKKRNSILLGPVITIIIMTLIIMITSCICSILDVQGEVTKVTNQSLETSVVGVKNIFSNEVLNMMLRFCCAKGDMMPLEQKKGSRLPVNTS